MILFNHQITIGQDYVTRTMPRPWFRIEKQEHAQEWEVLVGAVLLLITKQGT